MALLPGVALPAQQARLVDRIEAPMAYLAFDAGGGGAGALQRLLADPALGEIFRSEGADREALEFARSVLGRAAGEVELALTGIVPEGLPLVVLRAQLGAADAAKMRDVLQAGTVARPLRTVAGVQTFALQNRLEAGRPESAGQRIEAAVLGTDLVVANHGTAIEEVLTDTAVRRRVLSGDPRFVALREQLRAPDGSLLLFLDWPRFGRRLSTAVPGLSGFLWQFSGFAVADAVLAAVTPHGDDLRSTVLLALDGTSRVDGWLALAQPAAARTLLGDLPHGGLGGFVLAIEPRRMLENADAAPALLRTLRGGCGRVGLDLDRIVRRLGQRGALQLQLVPDAREGALSQLVPVFALQAQSRRAASELADDIAGAGQRSRIGTGSTDLHCVAADDLLLFGDDQELLERVRAERRVQRGRSAREAAVVAALQALAPAGAAVRCSGLVHLDLGGWLASERSGLLPLRHSGLLEVLPDIAVPGTGQPGSGADRTVVRLQLLSTR